MLLFLAFILGLSGQGHASAIFIMMHWFVHNCNMECRRSHVHEGEQCT